MPDLNTDTDAEFDTVVNLMADNSKLVTALSRMLDEKFGFQQGWMNDKLDEISTKLDQSIDENRRQFDTLGRNFENLAVRQTGFDDEIRKVNDRLDSIDNHLKKQKSQAGVSSSDVLKRMADRQPDKPRPVF